MPGLGVGAGIIGSRMSGSFSLADSLSVAPVAIWDADYGVYTGGSREFTAANLERFSIADNASLSTGDIDFSVSVWVYANTLPSNADIVGKGQYTGSAREWKLVYTSSRFTFSASSNGQANTEVSADVLGLPVVNTWYFIFAWHDSVANTINIQVDNGTADSNDFSGGPSDRTGDFFIGLEDPVYAQYFDGRISKAGFWKRTLTAAEKTSLYNSGNGKLHGQLTAGEKVSLASYWNLNENSGNAIDAEGSNNLTDTNTVTVNAGPTTSAAEDSSANDNHGTLMGFAGSQENNAWISDISAALDDGGSALAFDGSANYVSIGNAGTVTSADFYVRLNIDNQVLFSLQDSVATAVSVDAGVLTFGGGLTESAITVDSVSKTAAQAGAILNDNAWHRVTFTLASIAASNLQFATDGTNFGNIDLDEFLLDTGTVGDWGFNDGHQGTGDVIQDGDPVNAWWDRVAGYPMFQAGTKRPAFDLTSGVRSVVFDGVTHLMRSVDATLLSALGTASGTVVIVYEIDTLADFKTAMSASDEDSTNNQLVLYGYRQAAQPNVNIYHNSAGSDDNVHGSTTIVVNTKHLMVITSDGSSYAIRVDGNDDTETIVGGSNSGDWFSDISGGFDSLILGAQKHTSEGSHIAARIYIAAVLPELSAADIALIEANYP